MLDLEHLERIFRQEGRDALVEELRMHGDMVAPIVAFVARIGDILDERPEQFLTQLVGFLKGTESVLLADMVERADRISGAWLRPLASLSGGADSRLVASVALDGMEGITGMALAPDGRILFTGDDDGSVRVWDLDPLAQRAASKSGHDCIDRMKMSADGTRLVTVSDETIEIWDADTLTVLHAIDAHESMINQIALTADGRCLSASDDDTIKVWDVHTGALVATWQTDTPQVVAVSPDGRFAASAGYDDLRIWDASSGSVLHAFSDDEEEELGHESAPDAIDWLDGETFASACENIVLRRASDGEKLARLPGHPDRVNQMLAFANGTRMVSVAEDIRVWDLEEASLLARFQGHDHDIRSVVMTGDEARLITGDFMGHIKVWDMQAVYDAPAEVGHQSGIRSLHISEHGKRALSVGHDGVAIIWDARESAVLHVLGADPDQRVQSARFIEDATRVLVQYDNRIEVWDVEYGEKLSSLVNTENESYDIDFMLASPDGDLIVCSDSASTVTVWNLDTEEVIPLRARMSDAHNLAFTPAGELVLTWDRVYSEDDDDDIDDDDDDDDDDIDDDDDDDIDDDDDDDIDDDDDDIDDDDDDIDDDDIDDDDIDDDDDDDEKGRSLPVEIWDLDIREPIVSFMPETSLADSYDIEHPRAALISPDGARLVAASSEGAIYVWDRQSGALERVMRASDNEVTHLWWTELDRLAAADSYEECIRIWDVDTGEMVNELKVRGAMISFPATTSEGDVVAMCVEDETVLVMEIPSGRILGSYTHDCDISAVAMTGDGLTVAIGDDRGRVRFFDVVDG